MGPTTCMMWIDVKKCGQVTYKSADLKPMTYKSHLFGCHLTYKSSDTPSHTNQGLFGSNKSPDL